MLSFLAIRDTKQKYQDFSIVVKITSMPISSQMSTLSILRGAFKKIESEMEILHLAGKLYI